MSDGTKVNSLQTLRKLFNVTDTFHSVPMMLNVVKPASHNKKHDNYGKTNNCCKYEVFSVFQ